MDVNDVGQDKSHKDATEKYDAEHGTYKDGTDSVSVDDRLPTAQMPKGTDPSPFTLGPIGK